MEEIFKNENLQIFEKKMREYFDQKSNSVLNKENTNNNSFLINLGLCLFYGNRCMVFSALYIGFLKEKI